MRNLNSEIILPLHDGSDDTVSIIIVHKDRPEHLNLCLQSISVTSINNNYEIIVIDNNSGPDSQDLLDEIEDQVTVIRNKKNLYWSVAANQGAKIASKLSKHLIFMHCDVVVLNPSWIDLLTQASDVKKSGMIGTSLGKYTVMGQDVKFVEEWCVLMTRECWDAVGPWEERLPQLGMSLIMSLKAQKKGFQPQAMTNPICHHYKVFSLDPNEYEKLYDTSVVELSKLWTQITTATII